MATAREDNTTTTMTTNNKNPYEGGLGAGGKFRRKPYQRPKMTPYDRPPTALRNPRVIGSSNSNANGWLRKIVDPAQRLITSSAHKLFASVFRKRLTQAPHQPPDLGAVGQQQEAVPAMKSLTTIVSREQEAATTADQNKISSSGRDSFSELEQILKQKTFTRAEINHLTALLEARNIDEPVGHEEKRHEVLPLKSILPPAGQEELQIVPLQDKSTDAQIMTNKVVNSRVLDEEIASPAELAKAYMGHRPSKVGPAALGLRSQALREDSTPLSILPGPSKSPMLSLVPKSAASKGVHENDYTTPRSRGRSAIYSMARAPYSRIRQSATFKSAGLSTGQHGGLPLATRPLDHSGPSGSKGLKRSSAVFEDSIGSFGPIRRTRQKPNLSSQRGLGLAASEGQQSPLSTQKLLSVGATKQKYTDGLNKDENVDIPGRNMVSVSSKSTEMASKILQQLDKIVSPKKDKPLELKIATAKDKEPARLSPSKLQGQALRSLEHIDSSKFIDIARDNSVDGLSGKLLHNGGESSSKKQERSEADGPSKLLASSNAPPAVNGFLSNKDTVSNGSTVAVTHPQTEKKSAFRMNASEDFLDLDDDGIANGVASTISGNETEKQETPVMEAKKTAVEAPTSEKAPLVSDGKLFDSSFSKGMADLESTGMSVVAAKSDVFGSSSVPTTSTAVQPVASVTPSSVSDSAPSEKQSNAAPIFSFGDKVCSQKEQNNAPGFKFSSSNGSTASNGDKAPMFTFALSTSSSEQNSKFGSSSGSKLDSSERSTFPAGPIVPAPRAFGSDKVDDKKSGVIPEKVESASLPVAATSSSASTFTFGMSGFSPSNGSTTSTRVSADSGGMTSEKPLTGFTFPSSTSSSTSFLTMTTAPSLPSSGGALSSPASIVFKFGPSASIPLSQAPAASGMATEAAKKADKPSGIARGSPFAGSSAATTSTGSGFFGLSAGVNANADSKKPEAVSVNAANGPLLVQASPTSVSAVSGISQSALGSSSVASTSTDLSSAKTASGLSSAGSISSTVTFGLSSSSAADGSASSNIGTPSALFGSTWQSPKSTAFGSSFSSASASTGFSFGLSSASSSGFVFGSGGASSASSGFPTFGAMGASSASVAAPVFGAVGFSSASTAAPIFGAAGASSASSVSSVFGSAGSSSALSGSSIFGSPNTSFAPTGSLFGSTGTSFASSGSLFGLTGGSSASTNMPPFGVTGASSGSTFSFNSVPATSPSQPVFGNANPVFTFGSASSGNNESNMEDSMAEDTVQAAMPAVPVFGQAVTPQSSIMFGSGAPSGANPFQFGSQPNPATPQNISPFQASGSLEFNAGGGSFSLGTGGGDKTGRKIVKVNRHKQRRK